MKRTTNHPAHLGWPLCAFDDCTERATYHKTPLCREHAQQVWKLVEEHEPEHERHLVRGDFKTAKSTGTPRRYLANRPGHIYYLQVGDRVKIGFTADFYRRMMQYPPNSVLLATHPGTPAVEKEMHQDFRRYLADGREWFHPNAELDAHIAKVQEKYPLTTSIAKMREPMNGAAGSSIQPRTNGAKKV